MAANPDLHDRVALVTGASRGIGAAIAAALAEAGVAVAINYRQRAEAERVAAAIRQRGGRVVTVRADVSVGDAVAAMVQGVSGELGAIDILVNNAGIAVARTLDELSEQDFDQAIAVNLKSAFLCTQAVLPAMRARRWGRIVNISSGAARGAGIMGPHYNASKAGMEGLTRGYAARLAQEGITVNTVAPSLVETEMMRGRDEVVQRIPLGRMGQPHEIAQAVLMVIGNAYMTGQTVAVNGGTGSCEGGPASRLRELINALAVDAERPANVACPVRSSVMLEPRKEESPPAPSDARGALPSDRHARRIARTVLALGLGVLGLWIAADFLAPLGWAAILAITLWPLYARFVAASRERATPVLAPLVFTVLTGAIVFIPVALVAHQLARQGQAFVTWASQARDSGIPVPAWLAQMPVAADSAQQLWTQNLSDPKAASAWFQSINVDKATEWTSVLGGQLLHRSLMFLFCLVALFVFLRHGYWLSARLLDAADRVFGDPGEHLASKMVDAVRGTFLGTVVVAVVEGLLIGGAYVLAGVPSAALFTLLTVAFAMVPFGAWAAFSAAALTVLFSEGSLWAALAVFGWGATVMLIGDHFGWPALVGKSARLPFLLALVGVFGGLQAFGLIGLFLGPVIMAALMTVWREWLAQADDEEHPAQG